MRLPFFTLILTGGLMTAGMAVAQMSGQMMSPTPPASTTYGGDFDTSHFPSQQERYAAKIAQLKTKMLRLTAADGGELTAEHKASLQKELDSLNRRFGIKPAHG